MPNPSLIFVAWLVVCGCALAVGVLLGSAARRDARRPLHRERERRRHSMPYEMRHHRRAAGTWRGTHSARHARPSAGGPPASHALRRDERAARWRVVNLLDDTSDIPQVQLAALFAAADDDTAELIGATR